MFDVGVALAYIHGLADPIVHRDISRLMCIHLSLFSFYLSLRFNVSLYLYLSSFPRCFYGFLIAFFCFLLIFSLLLHFELTHAQHQHHAACVRVRSADRFRRKRVCFWRPNIEKCRDCAIWILHQTARGGTAKPLTCRSGLLLVFCAFAVLLILPVFLLLLFFFGPFSFTCLGYDSPHGRSI